MNEETQSLPKTGGRWIRDPDTGELRRDDVVPASRGGADEQAVRKSSGSRKDK